MIPDIEAIVCKELYLALIVAYYFFYEVTVMDTNFIKKFKLNLHIFIPFITMTSIKMIYHIYDFVMNILTHKSCSWWQW